ncbi:helix-turn-helix domain-containing protein [Agreia bicolorata]|uniref:helix-turn-helix domain-containing protein n=1 Tax=Agreia bicolorata TaxID=110935 RepID=UPI000A0318D5
MLEPYASRGVLHSHLLPQFIRRTPGAPLETRVRWFWAASWNLPDGGTSEQALLPFAAANLAVEPTGVTLTGPNTGAVAHTLKSHGWVVAANLQPAASAALLGCPTRMRDLTQAIIADDLVAAVTQAFHRIEAFDDAADAAVAALSAWIVQRVPPPSELAVRANRLLALVEHDQTITTLRDAADALHVSQRTVQRVAHDYIGMSVGEIIRRSRLQRTLEHVRESPTESLAGIAAANGYSDHAHMAAELRTITRQTATQYRTAARDPIH